jgi:FkbH-like protein
VIGQPGPDSFARLTGIANSQLDFLATGQVDRALRRVFPAGSPPSVGTKTVRLAILASSTVSHLLPAIRVAALRRGIWCETYETDYGQYLQELLDPDSGLAQFAPTVILFALNSHHLAFADSRAGERDVAERSLELVKTCWRTARERFQCTILHHTCLPVFDPLLGSNEWRIPSSPANTVARINAGLRASADEFSVNLIALDFWAARDGIGAWHNPTLWHSAKQEISPNMAPFYGDLIGRSLAADQGRSRKCLVLDLDHTLWGGVIGDDGLGGIALGQGSALGEAFAAFQNYALRLSLRGIILAVCSKNDEVNALLPFEKHTGMILKRSDIACFTANWQDKASNVRAISANLNIGLDSLVFVDDNPFERSQVRQELPMVAVPELPEDPALYATCLADAGYFEALTVTAEDAERAGQYRLNAEREKLKHASSDINEYLRSLNMSLIAGPFHESNLKRVVQLINKTNQFNLTTKRYSEGEAQRFLSDPEALTLQLRLTDRFGDNGIICIVIGRSGPEKTLLLDTWLMSCRVLGRQVEEATLNLIAAQAHERGFAYLIGEYRPTEKNGMVRTLYERLGFEKLDQQADGVSRWQLDVTDFSPRSTYMTVIEESYATTGNLR